ncbi:retrovirus-related pol polyprotein from transposon TNT 1-94 [Tanacetum coccineum]|uniref:Retrovirus-related pol polyprotein from transposon TNT 1-94 n=1 Tax=Tanacetum coccineum TaxID=301880 RepID=A0ABQ5BNZ8_9ASTR
MVNQLESSYSRFYKMMNELVRNQCNVTNHQVNVQFLLQLQPEWQRFVTLVKQSQELKTVSYHKLYDILKQHQNEVNEIRNGKTSTKEKSNKRVTSSAPTYDPETCSVTEDDEMSKEKEIDKLHGFNFSLYFGSAEVWDSVLQLQGIWACIKGMSETKMSKGCSLSQGKDVSVNWRHYMYMAQLQEVTPDSVDTSGPIFDDEPMHKDDQDETDDLDQERDLLASLIQKLKYFKTKNKSLESSNNHFKEANNELSKTNQLMFKDIKKFQAELDKYKDVNYASKIKLYKTREDKELDKVIALENKVKVLNDIVYKTGQSVQTMNMLNRNCKTSFAKPEFLKKAQRANPRLYDIGCYNDNLALMLTPDSDETIRLDKERRSKLSDLIRPFDYAQLNNLYDLFVPQREKSAQHNFPKMSTMSQSSTNNEFSKESFRKQPTLLEKRIDESIPWDKKCQSSKELFKIKKEGKFWPPNSKIQCGFRKDLLVFERGEEMVADLRYFNSLEHEVDTLKSQLETQKTQFLNEIDRLSREYYYADHMNAILGVYTDLDEFTNLQCDYVETWEKCEHLEKELSKSRTMSKSFEALQKHAINLELDLQQCKEKIKNDKSFKENQSNVFLKEREQYFEIQDLKAQLQDKGIAISELKKLIEKMKGKSVETKFEKSSVIRQPNAFKSQRQSILGKPAIFSDSLAKKDFSKSKPVTTQNVSNDFSKPVTAQILPQNMLPIVKNTNVIAPGMYKVHTKPNQTRTPQLHQDIRKPNKRVSFSTGVIPNTSVSRPQLKSNHLEDRVMSNNSQGKKQEVEDHRRKFKFSNNKTSVTACNDSLNAKTSNVNFVCVTCGKCVLNDNHDLCVLHYINGVNSRTRQPMAVPISTREPKHNVNQSVATSSKKTVATDSTVKKSRNITRKLYEQVSKTCSWWYPKYTPPGYNWKPKSQKGNVNPNVSMPLGNASRTANILEHKPPRFSWHKFLYSISLQDSITPNPIYLMAKATSSQAWLWHCRLSHLNFDTINLLLKNNIVNGLPKLKFVKDHLCSSCELGKEKRKSFHTKTTPSSKIQLQLLHMDLCGPMRVESINGKKYVLVIVDDYS